MPDMDELLQRKIQALEDGSPLEEVLKGMGDDAGELASLVQLAQSIRTLHHPVPLSERALADRKKVLAAAQKYRQQAGSKRSLDWSWLKEQWTPVYAILAVAICLIVVVLGGGIWLAGSRNAPVVSLAYVDGQVEILPAGGDESWHSVASDEPVSEGTHIRTHAGAKAILEYYDGSLTSIDSSSEIILVTAKRGPGSALQVLLEQNVGSTSHYVKPLKGGEGFFVVQTPAGNASVHGTVFNVSVSPTGKALYSVDAGEVVVSNAETEVTLSGGQATVSQPGQAPAEPAYQFTLYDEITATHDNQWSAAGVLFALADLKTAPQAGQPARVSGRILSDGSLIADQIEPAQPGEPQRRFTGQLKKMDGDIWNVGGKDIQMDASTILSGDLSLGSPVKVVFAVQEDGSWQALRLESLDSLASFSIPPVASPDPNAKPRLSFEPNEIKETACTEAFDLTGMLVNTADEPKDYATNVLLGYSILKGAEYVEWIELTPSGWEIIQAGEQVDFNIRVTLKPSWSTASDDTQVMIRIDIIQEANRSDRHQTDLTVTLSSSCEGALSPTPSPTPTSTVTSPPMAAPSGVFVDCTGTEPHPTGTSLAKKYSVTYEEIMGWFCQGFGFGEIDMVYGWRDDYHVLVTDIFNERISGKGWGEILQELDGETQRSEPDLKPTHKPTHTPKPEKKTDH